MENNHFIYQKKKKNIKIWTNFLTPVLFFWFQNTKHCETFISINYLFGNFYSRICFCRTVKIFNTDNLFYLIFVVFFYFSFTKKI